VTVAPGIARDLRFGTLSPLLKSEPSSATGVTREQGPSREIDVGTCTCNYPDGRFYTRSPYWSLSHRGSIDVCSPMRWAI
jgi:hypothetical protein